MVFSSMVFMCVFLPVVLVLYYLLPTLRLKNFLLIIASLLFYAYGEPVYVLLMIFSIIINYLFGRTMAAANRSLKKGMLALSVCVNLGFLVVFKYADMMIGTVNRQCGMAIPEVRLALPIGISFFTFQAMSYVIDAYRQDVKVQKNLWNMILYISFFPQLIAGPIVKYHDIEKQITDRYADLKEIAEGMRRFIIGLAKKVLISNTVAVAADALFGTPIGEINIFSAWIAAIAYMLQIYYDFSGYSDMAIGLGHMFGFHFLENFRHPYVSGSVQEFWRRWHISLSTWFKEYLYFPLGGNRKGKLRTCLNKIIVFFATGLWHGANWTFVLWGLWHGAFLLLEEILPIKKLPKVFRHLYTLLVVCMGFVMFRADTITQGIQMIGKMFTGWDFSAGMINVAVSQMNPLFDLTVVLGVVGSIPLLDKFRMLSEKAGGKGRAATAASYAGSFILLLLCMLSLSSGTYNPFIYFRF
ncbi:MBOAT family protein [Eubacterium sp. am_0171]|uniref:MBOAT family O-acyltransferase n=1 Tax=unclassified Eubacterium (in: firmicutes) TaxID=2624479 RepID=UPI0010201C3C|nr:MULTISPECIES: MBOAT family O-acyltransferase [unclassified Eubacterium (in: firmicutes)]MSC86308.1 MBOAT family protein [Eubacterium sp. BIOML-A1]MSD08624.1 MBOAT family protein [Eubacterium sp. BIOML-A2]RYT11757.1 MBOAT family protein [Eubacterium sp. am_0171]